MLLHWVNDELASERIVVKNIQEDFYDGQVIQKLLEKLANIKIEVPEVSQSEEGQKQKWRIIVDALNRNLFSGNVATPKWSAELIHQKVGWVGRDRQKCLGWGERANDSFSQKILDILQSFGITTV